MNSTHLNTKRTITPPGSSRKWVYLCLVILVACGAAWILNHSRARAAEPDLSLLRAAYAGSDVFNQQQENGSPAVFPAAAFRVDGSTRQWFFGFNSAYLYPSGVTYCGIAPVYLPDSAKVTSFVAYVMDDYATNDANVYLFAKPLGSTALSTTMADLATTGQNANLQALSDTTILQPVIDNSSYTYHIGVCLWGVDSSMSFYTAQILYSR
jgi:hypothetical protein